MQPEKILKSDVLDIIFENRNKDYGAYVLRRDYDTRMRNALLFTFSLVGLLLLLTSFSKDHPVEKKLIVWTDHDITLKKAPPFEKSSSGSNEKKKVVPVSSAPITDTRHIIEPDKSITKTVEPVKKEDDSKAIVTNNISVDEKGGTGTIDNKGKSDVVDNTADDVDPKQPVMTPDINAQFPGGMNALQNFLKNNIPKPEIGDDETVEVKVRFIVNPDGSIGGITIIKSGGDECDGNVVSGLQKMPDWVPAKFKGHNVATYFIIPIKFAGG